MRPAPQPPRLGVADGLVRERSTANQEQERRKAPLQTPREFGGVSCNAKRLECASLPRYRFEPNHFDSASTHCYISERLNWRTDCIAVIPCLNEEATIADIVERVRTYMNKVLVVDDGSRDQTAAAASKAGAEVLRHEISRGKGAALRAGWQRARELGFCWAISLDGDGQHCAEDIPAFFRRADEAGIPLIVGNRIVQANEMPWVRRQVNRWMSRRLSGLADKTLPDSQCGFRLINLEVLAGVPLSAQYFEIESDVLIAFIRAGHPVEFVPIRVIYQAEKSKIHPLRDTIRWWKWWRAAREHQTPNTKLQRNTKSQKPGSKLQRCS
ncbi:MAG: hypothetical protein C5B50_16425 [Verrucomicrobia bacterium]|nr:MAG: hypothetical protein C5B50_16425 [Verrucomicrobiota bacterium]